MSISSTEHETVLALEFEKLKKSAKSTKDIAKWFKAHPELIPNLPVELYKRVDVYASDDNGEETTDYQNKTIKVQVRLEFAVDHMTETTAKETLMRITGLKLGRNQNTNPFFQSYYETDLDAREWPFIAADILCSLDEEELDNKRKQTVYKNILETNFPNQRWDAFYALWCAGLVPEKPAELLTLLKQRKPLNVQLSIPEDLVP